MLGALREGGAPLEEKLLSVSLQEPASNRVDASSRVELDSLTEAEVDAFEREVCGAEACHAGSPTKFA